MKTKTSDLEDLKRPECREIGTALAVLAQYLRMQAAADCPGGLPQAVKEQCELLEAMARGFRRAYALPYRLDQLVIAYRSAPERAGEVIPILWPSACLQMAAEALKMLADLLRQSKDERAERIARLGELVGEAVGMARHLADMRRRREAEAARGRDEKEPGAP